VIAIAIPVIEKEAIKGAVVGVVTLGHIADKFITPIHIGETDTPWSVNLNIPCSVITADATRQMWLSILIGLTICLLSLAIVYRLISGIVSPLTNLSEMAAKVARGDLDYEEVETSNDEIGRVYMAFGEVAHSLRVITTICKAVALGDYTRSTPVRSDNDVLCQSINQMCETLRAVVNQANAIARGEYSTEIEPHSDMDELGVALANMTRQLRDTIAENQRENWLKTGQSELNDKMRGEQSVSDLSHNIITKVCVYLNAQIGAIFLAEDNQALKLVSSYAYTRREGIQNEFLPGQGLVGQALMEKEPIIITEVPDDYIAVQSGAGQAVPKNIMVVPLQHDNKAIGVLELGSFHEFTPMQVEFLKHVSENIAIAINAARSKAMTSELLEKTQRQSEALQNQQEELRATNEELEEQTQQLTSSEELLKSQQEELELSNAQLEEKTATLEEQKQELEKSWNQIQAKSQELEMTNKYKSEFLSNMSHELRTPLNSLLILSKLLTENSTGNLTDEQVESSKMIYEGGQELLSLINEILDLAKIEAGKMEFIYEDVSLSKLSHDLESSFMPTAQEKGLEFHMEVEGDLPDFINTDTKRVKQVLKNLLSNAFKFTSEGGVTVRISRPETCSDLSRSHLDHRNSIAFAISDTGIGIAEEKRKMIFSAFQQADGKIDRKYGGTGLGLSISTHIANLLGGEIQLASQEGNGSIFTLILPETIVDPLHRGKTDVTCSLLPEAPLALETAKIPAENPIAHPAVQPICDDRDDITENDKIVLIIEDDAKFATILKRLSHEKGFKCLVTSDGEAGLKSAVDDQPQAIILDVGLPGINGFSVINSLKDNAATRHIPVQFISAHNENQSVDRALSMGAIGYLSKPATRTQLDQVFGHIQEHISVEIKKLLVAEEDAEVRERIVNLIENDDVDIAAVGTGQEAYDLLKTEKFDCMVLDFDLPDMTGLEFLEHIENDADIIAKPPIVVYSDKDHSLGETSDLTQYSGNIILKDAKSPERLLDETSLFLHRIEASLPPEQQRMIRMAHEKETILYGKKVLVVDDDMRNIFALSHALKSHDMTIIRAENGQKALEMLEENPDTDVVLMDIMMPVMDGYEAIHKIREQKIHWKLPILALTANAMAGDRQKCIDAGANDYLAKPIDVDKVLSMLRVWLYV
jgi:CheY-like chemotaxis protein